MARDYGPRGGGKKGTDNIISILAGGVGATLLDFALNGQLTQPVGHVQSTKGKKVVVTMADYLQLGISGALGLYGFTGAGMGSRLPPFAWGMLWTQIITKFIFPSVGVARYLVYDIDSKGRLVKT